MISLHFARMTKHCFVIIVITLIFSSGAVIAQELTSQEIPEGMEIRMVGQTKLVVPEDAKIQEKEGLIIVESIDKYVARSLSEMKQTIETLKRQQTELIEEIQQLKNSLETKVKE